MSAPNRLRQIKDPVRRAQRAAEELAAREEVVASLREVRDEAVVEMMLVLDDKGRWKYRPVDAARAIGVTRAAIAKRYNKVRASANIVANG